MHAKSLSEPEPTGVAEYTRQLLWHMVRLPEAREHRFLFYVDDGYSSGDLDSRLRGNDNDIAYKILRSPFLWTQGRLALELLQHKPDVLFTPGHVLPKTAPKNSVVTIHGLEFERFPQFYPWHERTYLRWVTRDAVRRAARIIAVSEATKRDLMELYHVSEAKIVVIHHGASKVMEHRTWNIEHGTDNSHRDPWSMVHGPYFLYVGRVEKKKNVDGVIRAFAIVKERYQLLHKLMLAGSDGYGADKIRFQVSGFRFQNDIQLLGYVSEAQKWELLRSAVAFVFPSWYEGFGLPILEAQVASVPVITSNVSAMPEVGGRGALYVDPADPTSIADAMQKVATDARLRQQLIQKGLENYKRFSWKKCAKATLAVLTA